MVKILSAEAASAPWFQDPQWWTVIVTLLAVIAALLIAVFGPSVQRAVENRLFGPRIAVEFNTSPPDSHRTELRNIQTGAIVSPTFYLRMRVNNSGGSTMERVEAMITRVDRRLPNGSMPEMKEFLPLNLVWAHMTRFVPVGNFALKQAGVTRDAIQPQLYKFLDFGHLRPPEPSDLAGKHIPSSPKVVLELDVEFAPNTMTHILGPGEYVFTVAFAAANARMVEKKYRMIIADAWVDDEDEMLNKNISINKI
jgi:hypothetical protein